MIKEQKVIMIAGLPLVGKTTIAKAISEILGIRHLDIDENIRFPVFGLPHPESYSDRILKSEGQREMGQSYDLLRYAIEAHIVLNRSVIATATFSHHIARSNMVALMEKYPGVKLRVIWCCPTCREEEEVEEIKQRLTRRTFGVDYFGGCTTIEHYLNDRHRYPPMNLSHIAVDTFPPHSVEECVTQVLSYCKEE